VKKLSIGLRLTLWYLVIFLLAGVIFGVGMWLIRRQNLFDIADIAREGQASDLKRFLEARKDNELLERCRVSVVGQARARV